MPHVGSGRPADVEDDSFPEIELVRDVLVIPSPGHRADTQDWLDNPPVEDRTDLGNGVFIERLRNENDDLPDQVMDAASPRGLRYTPVRQFGQLYSFWREIPRDEWDGADMHAWDPTQAIGEAVALSRFVLDNAHSFEFVGRVLDRDDGHRQIASNLGYDGRVAYRTRTDRFWLTPADAEQLRDLLGQYREVKDALPDRVRRALWHADRSAYCRYINEAVTNVVTGFEALLNTGGDEPVAAQFVKRSQALATELGVETSRSYWTWVYEVRSRVVHGDEGRLVVPSGWDETAGDPPRDVARIAQAQDVLRSAVRRAIEDKEFRLIFADDALIREQFPLE